MSHTVDLWIIAFKDIGQLPETLFQLRKSPVSHKINVLDNSTDPVVETALRGILSDEDELFVSDTNLKCCGGSQYLLEHTSAPYIAYVCSKHLEINDPTWITDALDVLDSDPRMALVGCLRPIPGFHYYRAYWGARPETGVVFPSYLPKLEGAFSREYIADRANTQVHVQGGAWVAKREALLECDGFETALPHLFMDVELGVRLQCHGWKLGNVPSMYSEAVASVATPDSVFSTCKLVHYYKKSE